jgi:uncharacterized RDD family membrane protein YckC
VSTDSTPASDVVSSATNGVAPRALDVLVPIGSQYSGLATRMIALVIDVLIIQAVSWMVGGIAAVFVSLLNPSEDTQTVLLGIGAVIALLWAAGYFVFFWAATGQTPGNRVMEIRVQDAAHGRPLGPGRAAVRLVGAVVSALLLFIGYLMILVDSRRRALHDRLVHSVVVYAPSAGRRRAERLPR